MKFNYLTAIAALIFCCGNATGQEFLPDRNAKGELLAMNSYKSKGIAKPAAGTVDRTAGRRRAEAGDGVSGVSFSSGIDIGVATTKFKADTLLATSTGFKYGIEIGAKIPLFYRGNKQYVASATLLYQSFGVKNGFINISDAYKSKQSLTVTSIGVPLELTVINLNRNGGITGYYYEAGVNVNYVYKAGGDKDLIKQFNTIMIQPNVGLGFCFAMDGGERFNNRTALLGIYAADAITNMVKANGAAMHALFYGIKYTAMIN